MLSLACAFGAITWTVYDGILLRPLGYQEPDDIFFLWQTQPGHPEMGVSLSNFLDLQRENRSRTEMAAYSDGTATHSGGDSPVRVHVAQTTLNFPRLLGAEMALGRSFDEDEPPGAILLMHGFWTRQFGANPEVLGRTIQLSGRSVRIVGVLGESFRVPAAPEIDLLVGTQFRAERSCGRGCSSHIVLARLQRQNLRPTLQGLISSMADLAERFPEDNRGKSVRLVPLREQLLGAYERPLSVLLAGLGLILVMVLANLFCLALSRGAGRRGEWALREALGGSSSQVHRPAWLEGVWLSGGAVIAGSFLGSWLLSIFLALAPPTGPRASQLEFGWPVALPLLTLALLGSLTLALGQWLGGSVRLASHLSKALQIGESRPFLRRAVVPLQFAATAVLLVGSLALLDDFSRLTRIDPGFQARNLVTIRLALSRERYSSREARANFFEELQDRLQSVPMISSVAAIWLPTVDPEGNASSSYRVEDGAEPDGDFRRPEAELRPITPGYFETTQIPLLAGRDFAPTDNWTAVPVAIVSQSLAEAAWPGQNPIGKRITHGLRFGAEFDQGSFREVIGVVGDVRLQGLGRPALPLLYIPYNQSAPDAMSLILRSSASIDDVVDQVRLQVSELDDQIPLFWIDSLQRSLTASIAGPRFQTTLAGLFAALATLLAVTGTYGVMTTQITGQGHEVGVRLALGARPWQISRWVMATSLQLAGPGILLGLLISWITGQSFQGLLHETKAPPLMTVFATGIILGLACLVASLSPALSASRIDPVRVLRTDRD